MLSRKPSFSMNVVLPILSVLVRPLLQTQLKAHLHLQVEHELPLDQEDRNLPQVCHGQHKIDNKPRHVDDEHVHLYHHHDCCLYPLLIKRICNYNFKSYSMTKKIHSIASPPANTYHHHLIYIFSQSIKAELHNSYLIEFLEDLGR